MYVGKISFRIFMCILGWSKRNWSFLGEILQLNKNIYLHDLLEERLIFTEYIDVFYIIENRNKKKKA